MIQIKPVTGFSCIENFAACCRHRKSWAVAVYGGNSRLLRAQTRRGRLPSKTTKLRAQHPPLLPFHFPCSAVSSTVIAPPKSVRANADNASSASFSRRYPFRAHVGRAGSSQSVTEWVESSEIHLRASLSLAFASRVRSLRRCQAFRVQQIPSDSPRRLFAGTLCRRSKLERAYGMT